MTAAAPVSETPARPTLPFTVIGLAGILFAVIGAVEIGTLLVPFNLGSPEWEFGTYSALMDTLPLFMMGIGFLVVFAVVGNRRVLGRVLAIILFLVALALIGFAFLYATDVPRALQVGPRTPMQTILKKAVSKSAWQTVVYPVAVIWLGAFAWRHSRRD